MPVARLAGSEHGTVEHVQCSEQRGCAVTNIIVRDAFDVAEAHRQHGLRAFERLTLALLVHAQDQGILGRAQVQADHVAQFLDEELIGRELEAFAAMRLQAEQLEVTVHTRRRDSRFGGDRAYAPVARVTSAAEIERERAIEVSCERSSSLSTSSAFGRPMGMLVSPVP